MTNELAITEGNHVRSMTKLTTLEEAIQGTLTLLNTIPLKVN
jgi:hypothetical protein